MKAKFLFVIFVILFVQMSTDELMAHESMVTKGYFSCLACHQSSTGSGLLNSYGRGIAKATSVIGGEYRPGKLSQALSINGRLNQQLQARVAHIDRTQGDSVFPMQADYLAAMRVRDSSEVAITVARAPKSARVRGEDQTVEEAGGLSQLFIRKLMLTQELSESVVLELGRDYVSYGLKPEDHTLFFQAENRFGLTDFPTQLRAIYEGERSRHFLSLLAPSGQESKTNKEWGASVKNEWLLFDQGVTAIIGLNGLKGRTDRIDRTLLGVHLKLGWGPLFLQAQLDHNTRVLQANDQSFDQVTGFARMELRLVEWLSTHITREWFQIEDPFERRRQGFGIGSRFRMSESISLSGDYKEVKQGRRVDKSFLTQAIFNIF
jgi:hypothetical protein